MVQVWQRPEMPNKWQFHPEQEDPRFEGLTSLAAAIRDVGDWLDWPDNPPLEGSLLSPLDLAARLQAAAENIEFWTPRRD